MSRVLKKLVTKMAIIFSVSSIQMSSAGDLEITNMAVPSKKMKLAPEVSNL